ncbi:MAG: alpha-glucan family phosphorylase [Phycisphaerae bacterium]
MGKVRTFTVVPALPDELAPLRELAYNLWWSWNPDAFELFRRLDLQLWEAVYHNPVRFLAQIDQRRLEQAARDRAYLTHQQRVMESLQSYLAERGWFDSQYRDLSGLVIAYFSAEFGLHESLPIYSGGLGVLSGDLLKSASDLGVPLVAVGMLYRQGYLSQFLTSDGWQMEDYADQDFQQMPLTPARTDGGRPLEFPMQIKDQPLMVRLWQCQVGRVTLYLLDTDLPSNPPELRAITSRLYGGDQQMRIRQEIVLGIGGLEALARLGIEPAVCHMNEGHSAFAALERMRRVMQRQGLSFEEARQAVVASNVFTTHTPEAAGIDTFPPELVEAHLGRYADQLGLSKQQLLGLGRFNPADQAEPFCMAVLGLRLSGVANGVSRMHGQVARRMWARLWPGAPASEVPIRSITNGTHVRGWLSIDMAELLDRYLGPDWSANPVDTAVWRRVGEIPDAELWRTHERRRERLVAVTRQRLVQQLRRAGAAPAEIKAGQEVLDPDALTIGFARRFAPYKRANLILQDKRRLTRIITDAQRPVQIIFAGKAHPQDKQGKELIRQVISFARQPEIRRHVVFLEDYDLNLARYLVQGCDIWLNTPQPMHEASGTSGMKVPPNGGINVSVLDGWWPEAWDGQNGWAIGDGRTYDDPDYQNHVEAQSIYDLLEKEIVPLFYQRGADGLPRGWIARMKASMQSVSPIFNTNRMLADYTEQLYGPAARRWVAMSDNDFAAARELARWKARLAEQWSQVKVVAVQADDRAELPVGAELQLQARVHLGPIRPQDVTVEVFYGRLDRDGHIIQGTGQAMTCQDHSTSDGTYRYRGAVKCTASGQFGYTVRVLAHHPNLAHRYDAGLICWG